MDLPPFGRPTVFWDLPVALALWLPVLWPIQPGPIAWFVGAAMV